MATMPTTNTLTSSIRISMIERLILKLAKVLIATAR